MHVKRASELSEGLMRILSEAVALLNDPVNDLKELLFC